MKIRLAWSFLLSLVNMSVFCAQIMSEETAEKAARFFHEEKETGKKTNFQNSTVQEYVTILKKLWQKEYIFPLKENTNIYEIWNNRKENLRRYHDLYKKTINELDPNWEDLNGTIAESDANMLLSALALGNILGDDNDLLVRIAQQLDKNIKNTPSLYDYQLRERIKNSDFDIPCIDFKKIGSYEYCHKKDGVPGTYSYNTVNFFAQKGYFLLPTDNTLNVARIKKNGEIENHIMSANDKMLLTPKPNPFWLYGNQNKKTASVRAFTIEIAKTDTDKQRVTITKQYDNKNKKQQSIDLLLCTDISQFTIDPDCLICASSESADKQSKAIIIDFKRGNHYKILQKQYLSSPKVYHNGGLAFIQWEDTINCLDLSSGMFATYKTNNTIKTSQVSQKNRSLIIGELLKTENKNDDTNKFIYTIYRIKKNQKLPLKYYLKNKSNIENKFKKKQAIKNQPKKKQNFINQITATTKLCFCPSQENQANRDKKKDFCSKIIYPE